MIKTLTLFSILAFSFGILSQSWEVQYNATPQSLYDCHFASATTGFAVGMNTTVLKTTDAGANWTPITIPNVTAGSVLYSVYNYGGQPDFVIVSGGWDVVSKSTDGGATWTNATLPPNGTMLYDFDMASPTSGFAVGRSFGTVYPAIYKTDDGAATFSDMSANIPATVTGEIRAVDFEGGSLAYFVGENGVILMTTDGGFTITQIPSGTTEHLTNIDIVGNEGWIVGDNGTILRTADAGLTWTPVSNPFTAVLLDIVDVQILGAGDVYVSGQIGIARTTDGGVTWSQEYNDVDNGGEPVNSIWIANMNGAWGTGSTKVLVRNNSADISDIQSNELFKVFPNPSSDMITIQNSGSKMYKLTSIDGEVIETINVNEELNYSLDRFSSGVYFLTEVDSQITQKIIKK